PRRRRPDGSRAVDRGRRPLPARAARPLRRRRGQGPRRLQRRPGRGAALRRRPPVRRDPGLRPEGPRLRPRIPRDAPVQRNPDRKLMPDMLSVPTAPPAPSGPPDSASAPPGRETEGPPFKEVLKDHQARTAPAEGRSGRDDPPKG